MKKIENKILVILSIGAIISLFIVIRECGYSLVWDITIMRWLFTSQSSEKLMSNIAFSYLAAYIFYIIQVYIPKILVRKNVRNTLVPKIREFIFKVSELSFVMEQICDHHDGGISVGKKCFPLYYKFTVDGTDRVKKVGDLDTVLEMQRRIEEAYSLLLNRFVIYDLDISILEVWEKIPLQYYREIIGLLKLNGEKNVSIVVRGIEEEDKKTLESIKKIFKINTNVQFERIEMEAVKKKYEQAAKQSALNELDLVLQLEKINFTTKKPLETFR